MAAQTKVIFLQGIIPRKNLDARPTLALSRIPLVVVFMSLLTPIFGQLASSQERDQVFGRGIINTPNHNSSSGVPNMPFVEIPTDELIRIGHVCEHDSDCENYSICMLKKMDDETAIKICQCDPNEMKRINQTCYIQPGHQCFFPNMNSHGYRFLECWPGSRCRKKVNRSMPENGYCMCDLRKAVLYGRDLDPEFEMAHCEGSSLYNAFYRMVTLSMILAKFAN